MLEPLAFDQSVPTFIERNLKFMSRWERRTRESTITVRATKTLTQGQIVRFMKDVWTQISNHSKKDQLQEDATDMLRGPAAFVEKDPNHGCHRSFPQHITADKEHVYIQFINCAVKNKFLEFIQLQDSVSCPMREHILPPVPQTGFHFAREMVHIEITDVPSTVSTDSISSMIMFGLSGNCKFSEFRDGKPYGALRKRSIMFRVNDCAFKHLFDTLNGDISVVLANSPRFITKTLYFRVSCRARRCKQCFSISPSRARFNNTSGDDAHASDRVAFGRHRCKGRICAKCGAIGHDSGQCSEMYHFCVNCKRLGHGSKHLSCPTYLRAVLKELQRFDLPLEYLEEDSNRARLAAATLV